jgi:hypothetical protein
MIVFLEAECVITRLIEINFITPKIWKRQMLETTKYYAIFDHIPTGGKLCFEIHIDNGVHKLSAMYIHNLERIHQINLQAIINACII